MKLITIGSDPELFLIDAGKIVSAIGKVGGSKKKPKPMGEGFSIQEDNILVEFNTPPVKSKKDFIWAINRGKALVEDRLPTGTGLLAVASANVDPIELTHKNATAFGCDPDLNAWEGGNTNTPPNPDTTMRTTSGHIYIGYENSTKELNIKIAKAMDIFAGVPSVFIDPDRSRRQMYGTAGAFRHKSFGLEYRALSSFWITEDRLIDWAYESVLKALEFVSSGGVDNLSEDDQSFIVGAINGYNEFLAEIIMEKFNIKLP